MTDIFDYGDPYIAWNEEISAREEQIEEEIELLNVGELQDIVVKLLITEYNFLADEAEEKVEKSAKENPHLWHENAEAGDLAKYLASDEDED